MLLCRNLHYKCGLVTIIRGWCDTYFKSEFCIVYSDYVEIAEGYVATFNDITFGIREQEGGWTGTILSGGRPIPHLYSSFDYCLNDMERLSKKIERDGIESVLDENWDHWDNSDIWGELGDVD